MKLLVKLITGIYREVEINPGATVSQLKKEIEQLTDVPATSQKLAITKDGRNLILENGKRLDDYSDLSDGDTVAVLVTEEQVFLKNHKGENHRYSFNPSESVADFSGRVSRQEGVPQEQQRLIYDGRALNESKRMADYSIRGNSTVHQTLRLRGGSYQE
ncbi:polyubiquitin-like [Megalops cyprinoides]|uniref:polyubiquitin-like n=1 Tax=Megalops cyprinoides TaxID=118141 RepID=UPI0018654EEC|nr:polyubiquitin-like [Megalops cyprinoides]